MACLPGLLAAAGVGERLSPNAFARLEQRMITDAFPTNVQEFSLQDVVAARILLTRQDAGQPDEEESEFIVWAADGSLMSNRGAVPPQTVADLSKALAAARPVMGLRNCGNVNTVSGYLRIDISLLIEGRRTLRLRSESHCAHRLPWNVTDGSHLAAIATPAAGTAILSFANSACGGCIAPSPPELPGAVAQVANSDFNSLYTRLISDWRRFGKKHGATDIKLMTLPLTAALEWMDSARFERALGRTAAGAGGAAALARDIRRKLRAERWGYIDEAGKFIIPRRFDKAEAFDAGQALVRVGRIWQLVDRRGRTVSQPRTGEPRYQEVRLQPAERDGKWGYADKTGTFVIPASFDAAQPFHEGLAAVLRDGSWGYIDERGGYAITPRYSAVRHFSQGRAAVRTDLLWGYADRTGRFVISPRFLEAGDFSEGMAPVR